MGLMNSFPLEKRNAYKEKGLLQKIVEHKFLTAFNRWNSPYSDLVA